MTHTDILQRTTEWHQLRLGKPTASRFGDIKPGRGAKWSQTTLSYMLELLAERMTGQWKEQFGNAIEWGLDHEDEAREAYQALTGNTVNRIGFVEQDGIGGSPDGLVGDDGCIEIKCPYNSANHLDYMLNGCGDHMPQIQATIYLNNRRWCDFISYDPRFLNGSQLYIQRVERDDNYIANMLRQVREFEADLNELQSRLS